MNHRLRTVLIPAGARSAAAARATAQSVRAAGNVLRPVVLAAGQTAGRFEGFDVVVASDVLPAGSVAADVLGDDDLLAFAEPFAVARLLAETGPVVTLTAGAYVVGAPVALERALVDRPVALAAPVVVVPSDTTVPYLTLRDPNAPLSSLLVAVAPGSEATLTAWQRTMTESLFDPNQTPPSELRSAVLATLLGSESVATEGTASVIRWSDYAAVIADGRWDGTCFAVDAAELWELAAASRERVGGDMTEAEYRLVDLRVHDASPLDPLIDVMHEAIDATGPQDEVTPFETLTREIRRCADPLGTLWPPGGRDRFEAWLFERNERGLTRIADLFWYASEDLRSRFPNARTSPADYLAWCRGDGPRILGFDLLDRAITPVIPDSARAADTPGGWKHAVKWRWNVVRGLVPGLAEAEERRSLGLDVVSGPKAGGRTEPPRRLQVARAPAPWGSSPRSLSLIGCLRAESGLGQASRASLRALRSLELPFTYIDTSEKYPSRNAVDPGLDRSAFGAVGDVNLIHANAMEIVKMNNSVFRHRLGGRFNAAMWFWEAGNLPAWKLEAFDRIDELWVASSYLADVLGQYGRVPVHSVGLAAPLPSERSVDRRTLGIPDDDFVFLFVYDALSSHGRKNPELALRAYIDAFGPGFDGVRLIVKASNLNKLPVDRDRLMEPASQTDSISVVDRYLDHEAVYDLMAAADVYVSLHAAEGYGLTILEAMSLGTPCICTGYSGNMDFTSTENSWLVDYRIARTREIAGPYPKGSVWAVPDSEHAAVLMRRAASHPEEVAAKGIAARAAAIEAASLDRYADELGRRLAAVM